MTKLQEFKEEMKRLVYNVRMRRAAWKEFHSQHKQVPWAYGNSPEAEAYKNYQAAVDEVLKPYPYSSESERRHKHIAYSMLKGKEYEQIEPYVRPGNEPSMKLVEQYMEEYSEGPETEEVIPKEEVLTGRARVEKERKEGRGSFMTRFFKRYMKDETTGA